MNSKQNIPQRLKQTDSIRVGGPPSDSMASLCIYADDLDPDFISESLTCRPSKSRRKGERYADRPKIGPAKMGQWFLEAPDELPFVEKIQFLLDSTTDVEDTWRKLTETYDIQMRTAIFLTSWTEGFELPHNVLAEIVKRRWTFSMAMYSADGDEIIDSFLDSGKDKNDSQH